VNQLDHAAAICVSAGLTEAASLLISIHNARLRRVAYWVRVMDTPATG
jgi:hypothetical protein